MKKLIAFDLDGTLADSKSPLDDRMADLLGRLLEKFHVCVISGGGFGQFEKQVLARLPLNAKFKKLHLMPTCGTRYYAYDSKKADWHKVYAEDLSQSEKAKIIDALSRGVKALHLSPDKVYGQTIEDRESQITYSALGQDIVQTLGHKGVEIKDHWDTDNAKKNKLRDYVAQLIPEFEVRVGGVTSIDVTKPGIDKAYGMRKLMEHTGLSKTDILFVGDRLQEGGNDYPVKAYGIDSIEISRWQETAAALEAILHVL